MSGDGLASGGGLRWGRGGWTPARVVRWGARASSRTPPSRGGALGPTWVSGRGSHTHPLALQGTGRAQSGPGIPSLGAAAAGPRGRPPSEARGSFCLQPPAPPPAPSRGAAAPLLTRLARRRHRAEAARRSAGRRARGDGGGGGGGAGREGAWLGLAAGPARMAGGAGWAGAPAALLRSVRRLREVFEVCGRDPDGFLRVERVAALGLRFGQGEEVRAPRRGCPGASPPTPGFLALSPARSQSRRRRLQP